MRVLTPILMVLLHLLFTLQLLTMKFLLVCTYTLLWDLHTLPSPKTTQQRPPFSPHLPRDIPSHLYALPTIFTLLLILTVSSHVVLTCRHYSDPFWPGTRFLFLETGKAVIWGWGLFIFGMLYTGAREVEEEVNGRESWPKGHQMVFAGVVT
ncbi:hypothetical protein TI39_contig690g00004 [Zymoseptoria brevis]|uniref:Uncharacterized protein n=1 Tax=Zymoseptoria brevis TaxID=1047168 RepID=A0A0F4GGU5_9PEZI|nr:hypothetical protein TI39_contig690g00004 [Zymoseptoria brevis]